MARWKIDSGQLRLVIAEYPREREARGEYLPKILSVADIHEFTIRQPSRISTCSR